MKDDYIRMFQETSRIIANGQYKVGLKKIRLKLSESEIEEVVAFPPEQIQTLIDRQVHSRITRLTHEVDLGVSIKDSYTAALDRARKSTHRVLVLNFANPVVPGGEVINGAMAQEEDLCRRSTLYKSITSTKASTMYQYNRQLNSDLASDYMLLSPNVEVFRDNKGALMEKTRIVSVLSAAAPRVAMDKEEWSRHEMNKLIGHRIRGMLHVASHYKYKHIVLGAWGCGAFGNDPENMAKLFEREIKNFQINIVGSEDKYKVHEVFRDIEFAIWSKSKQDDINYKGFEKYFKPIS